MLRSCWSTQNKIPCCFISILLCLCLCGDFYLLVLYLSLVEAFCLFCFSCLSFLVLFVEKKIILSKVDREGRRILEDLEQDKEYDQNILYDKCFKYVKHKRKTSVSSSNTYIIIRHSNYLYLVNIYYIK